MTKQEAADGSKRRGVSDYRGNEGVKYIDDAVGALDIHLADEDVAYLEEMYVPHPVIGAIDKNPEQGVMLLDEKNRKCTGCMIFILSNKEREDKDYEEKYRIGKELFEADMLVIVTPLYYYGMSAQMKTVIAGLWVI